MIFKKTEDRRLKTEVEERSDEIPQGRNGRLKSVLLVLPVMTVLPASHFVVLFDHRSFL